MENLAANPIAIPLAHNRGNHNWELHNGLCEDNRDNACCIHLQRNMGRLAAHLFPALDLLAVLDRDLTLPILKDNDKDNCH